MAPTISILGPQVIGLCDPLVLDATSSGGSGGRSFTSSNWTVDVALSTNMTVSSNLSALLVAADNSLRLSVPASLLPTGSTIAFRLQVQSFLGSTASSVFTVAKVGVAVPIVVIKGPPSLRVTKGQDVLVEALISVDACTGITLDRWG